MASTKPVFDNLSLKKRLGNTPHRFICYAYPQGVTNVNEVQDVSRDITESFLRSVKYAGIPITADHGDWDWSANDYKRAPRKLGEVVDAWFDEQGRLMLEFELPPTFSNQIESRLIRDGLRGDVSLAFITEQLDPSGPHTQRLDHIAITEKGNQPQTHIVAGTVPHADNPVFLANPDLLKQSNIAMLRVNRLVGGIVDRMSGDVGGEAPTPSAVIDAAPAAAPTPTPTRAIVANSQEFARQNAAATSNKITNDRGYIPPPSGQSTSATIPLRFYRPPLNTTMSSEAATIPVGAPADGAAQAAAAPIPVAAAQPTQQPQETAAPMDEIPSDADVFEMLKNSTESLAQQQREMAELRAQLEAERRQRQADETRAVLEAFREAYREIPDEILNEYQDTRDTPQVLGDHLSALPADVGMRFSKAIRVMAANSHAKARELEEARQAAVMANQGKSAAEMEQQRLRDEAALARKKETWRAILNLKTQNATSHVNATQPSQQQSYTPAVPNYNTVTPPSVAIFANSADSQRFSGGSLPMPPSSTASPAVKRSFLETMETPCEPGTAWNSASAKRQRMNETLKL